MNALSDKVVKETWRLRTTSEILRGGVVMMLKERRSKHGNLTEIEKCIDKDKSCPVNYVWDLEIYIAPAEASDVDFPTCYES